MITNPTLVFFVVMMVILLAPIIMGKLRIPHIIGLVLAGVALGEFGFGILVRDNSFELFGRVGLYYIMFLASLEMDLEGAKKNKVQIGFFTVLTFLIPFTLIYFTGRNLLNYSVAASLLLGCIMASNTLVAYPIVSRFGLSQKPSVSLSVSSSMGSLFISLIVLAAIVSAHNGSGGWLFWLMFVVRFAVYVAGSIFIIPRLTRWFLRSYSDAVMQFVYIMAVLFFSAALAELIGLEGILGAFFSGFILNRYIPHTSPLMNRIEFIGNALFIPYFLIGVGMLINVRLLFEGSSIIVILVLITVMGTLGKALAAYTSQRFFKLPTSSGTMMFGLTSAHAAGAIAIIMVGMGLTGEDGKPMVDDQLLNAIVLMILVTCIISSMVTQHAAQTIILRDEDMPNAEELNPEDDDERVLVPVKYPEYADRLIDLTLMMRNQKLHRSIVALNVAYEDDNAEKAQQEGKKILEGVVQHAASYDVSVQTQVRVAANIANGIRHAFMEFHASEIIIGMHSHGDVKNKFWGQFHQSLFNGLNRQIIMARMVQPLNTLRLIQVVIPSRAQLEPGFYRWLERVCRLAGNLECKIIFNGRQDTLGWIEKFIQMKHPEVRAAYKDMAHWNELPQLASSIEDDHLLIVVTARKGTVSYKAAQDKLPDEITRHFTGKNIMIIFPDQFGDAMNEMTFAQPQHTEELSAYEILRKWAAKKINLLKNRNE